MLLIKSLLCFRGFDNGRRFLLISLACYALFLMVSPVLAKAPVLLVLLLLIATPVLLAGSMRRVHDAGFATPLAAIPVAFFWLAVLGITYITHGASYFLLGLSFIATLAGTTLSNAKVRRNRQYQWGYCGPVSVQPEDRVASARRMYDRIEPTIASGNHQPSPSVTSDQVTHSYVESSLSTSPDVETEPENYRPALAERSPKNWEQQLGEWFVANRKLSLTAALAIVVMVISLFAWTLFTSDPDEVIIEEQPSPLLAAKERINKIQLPDNFWVMLDQHNALTVAWQGDLQTDGEIWSAMTAIGDRECVEIRFNDGDSYRTMRVEVKNQGDYYADFSPVDTLAVVEAIAKKSRFSLCGFDFSLKGTQALLMSNKAYFDMLTQD